MPKNYSSNPELTVPDEPEFDLSTLPRKSRSLNDVHTRHRHSWWAGKGSGGREHRHNRKDKTLHRQHSIPEAHRHG